MKKINRYFANEHFCSVAQKDLKIIYDIEGDNHGVRKISAHRANRDGRNKRH